jgi:hypothetical protein
MLTVLITDDDSSLLMHARVHALADMLDIPGLRELAAAKLKEILEKNWVAQDFAELVKEVYATTAARNATIRDVMVGAAATNFSELSNIEDFKKVLYELGEFSGALVLAFPKGKKCCNSDCLYFCDSCGRNYTVPT